MLKTFLNLILGIISSFQKNNEKGRLIVNFFKFSARVDKILYNIRLIMKYTLV